MRWPRPQLTIQSSMAAIALLALSFAAWIYWGESREYQKLVSFYEYRERISRRGETRYLDEVMKYHKMALGSPLNSRSYSWYKWLEDFYRERADREKHDAEYCARMKKRCLRAVWFPFLQEKDLREAFSLLSTRHSAPP